MEKLSIIIPVYSHWAMTKKRLLELSEHCHSLLPTIEVIIADDNSWDKESEIGFHWFLKSGIFPEDGLKVVKGTENVGFGGNANRGTNSATGEIVIILSSDVEIRGNFVFEILSILNDDPKCLIGGRLLEFDTGWNRFGNEIFPYLEGWLIACRKETWNSLGGFDTRYGIYDYEDVDLSTTARKQERRLVPLSCVDTPNPCLYHIGGITIHAKDGPVKRRFQTNKNRKVFEEKWIKSK